MGLPFVGTDHNNANLVTSLPPVDQHSATQVQTDYFATGVRGVFSGVGSPNGWPSTQSGRFYIDVGGWPWTTSPGWGFRCALPAE